MRSRSPGHHPGAKHGVDIYKNVSGMHSQLQALLPNMQHSDKDVVNDDSNMTYVQIYSYMCRVYKKSKKL